MGKFKPKGSVHLGPEAKLRARIVKHLELMGWFVVVTHGSIFQVGLPDLFATHKQWGSRWIEIKRREAYVFTPAQKDVFKRLCENGSGVWVMMDESEYDCLFKPPNWEKFL
jgi:hypothetical protein